MIDIGHYISTYGNIPLTIDETKHAFLLGATGCLHPDTPIYDPIDESLRTVKERYALGVGFHVFSLADGKIVIAEAEPPIRYRMADMFELRNGDNVIITTGEHRVWDGNAYVSVNSLLRGATPHSQSCPILLPTIEDASLSRLKQDVRHWKKTGVDFLGGCRLSRRLYGQQPRPVIGSDQASAPSRGDALGRNCVYPDMDGWGSKAGRIHSYQSSGLHSKMGYVLRDCSTTVREYCVPPTQGEGVIICAEGPFGEIPEVRSFLYHKETTPAADTYSITSAPPPYVTDYSSYGKFSKWLVQRKRDDVYYDFHVSKYENYFAAGLFHHNTGKSTVLEELIYQNIQAGNGVLVIDPHGPLVENVLKKIPKERTDDVIIVDPLLAKVVGFNIFSGRNKDAALGNFTKIVGSTWKDSWGPRSDYITRNAGQALIATEPELTVIHFAKFFMSAEYRETLRTKAADPVTLSFFQKFDEDWNDRQREEAAAAPHNKMDMFLQPVVRPIVGQYPGFDMREAMDSRKIVLCKFSKADIGPDMPAFLSSVVLYLTLSSSMGRPFGAPHFSVFVDEFHNLYRGDAPGTILSETRKYGISLTLADQTIDQLPEGSESSIFGNIWTLMVARIGADDAQRVYKHLGLQSWEALTHQGLGEWYIKTTKRDRQNKNYITDPLNARFTLRTAPAGMQDAEIVKRQSLRHWGKDRRKVEEALRAFLSG